ncbi:MULTISPECIES: hypothetical protein [Enterococcus]|nr:hypothetical protein [Enterococcus faecalis]EHS2034595.1 hypothetical protein [Enterococcus faecalis]EIA1377393.1 hypothetical protein [Enterococcus faecalis]EJI7260618.1 hypothetical protein [Enterococcus faecalis]HBC4453652.1 hypothetical protein [Enterococcus faecalis]HCW2816306.1 hypothetical protein [Enterococcus faecalis]
MDNGYYCENKKNFNASLATIATVTKKRPRGGNATTMVIGLKLLSEFLE